MQRGSLQGVPHQTIYRSQLKEKDEFEFETKKKNNKKKKKKSAVRIVNGKAIPHKKKYKGSFIVKFDGEEEVEYIIGENISMNAPIVKMVYEAKTGDELTIGVDKFKIIRKRFD